MRISICFMCLLLAGAFMIGCENSAERTGLMDSAVELNKNAPNLRSFVTGEIEFAWKGGNGENSPDIPKFAFVDFNAQEESEINPARGEFTFRVVSEPDQVHRQIVVTVDKVLIETTDTGKNLAWFRGYVISDTKGCNGGETPGSHSGDCSNHSGGCNEHPDGGCSEGGCTGGEGSMEGHDGSCTQESETSGGECVGTEGGCDGDHPDGSCPGGGSDGGQGGGTPGGDCSGEEGGCDGDHPDGSCPGGGSDGGQGGGTPGGNCSGGEGGCDGDHPDGSCPGGGSGGGHSGGINGKLCRVGQLLYVKVHDGGTPGIYGDGVKWKWFAPDIEPLDFAERFSWKLCKKTIVEGNMVIHM